MKKMKNQTVKVMMKMKKTNKNEFKPRRTNLKNSGKNSVKILNLVSSKILQIDKN